MLPTLLERPGSSSSSRRDPSDHAVVRGGTPRTVHHACGADGRTGRCGRLDAEHLQPALGGLELGTQVGVLLLELGDVLVLLGVA